MKMKLKLGLFCILAMLVMGTSFAYGADTDRMPGLNLKITEEQIAALEGIFDEYSSQNLAMVGELESKFADLKFELSRPDRFEGRMKASDSKYTANKLVNEISKLYGEILKTRVKYLLKAKDILTREQREILFARLLEFDFDMPDELFAIVEIDLLLLDIDLSIDQVKEILRYRAEMEKKAIDINYKIDLQLIDLQVELFNKYRNPEKINKTVLTITDLGNQLMDNRVKHFLKAKDVLTVYQKKALLHSLSMM